MAGFYESLNKQNYLKAMQGSYSNYGITSDSVNNLNSQQNINTAITLNDQIQSNINNAESATTEENHDDDANWFEKIGNSIMNIFYSFEEGVLNFADGIGDFAMGAIGGIAGALGNADVENAMKQGINTDWQAGVVNFTKSINDTVNPYTAIKNAVTGKDQGITKIGQSLEDSRSDLNKVQNNGAFGEGFNSVVGNISKGVGQMIPSLVTGKVVSGAVGSLTSIIPEATSYATKTANIVTQASLGAIQGMGSGYSTVAKEDGDLTSGSLYAGLKGLYQGATRGLSGAFGTLSDNVSNGIAEFATGKMLEAGKNQLMTNIAGIGIQILSDMAVDATTEFGEELLDPVLKQISYDQEAIYKAYGTSENTQSTLANAGMSALTSALTTMIVDGVHTYTDRPSYVQKYLGKHPEFQEALEKARAEVTKNDQRIENAKEVLETAGGENAPDEMKQAYAETLDDTAKENAEAYGKVVDAVNTAKQYGESELDENIKPQDIAIDATANQKAEVESADANKIDTASANAEANVQIENTEAKQEAETGEATEVENKKAKKENGIRIKATLGKDSDEALDRIIHDGGSGRIVVEIDGVGFAPSKSGKLFIDSTLVNSDEAESIKNTLNHTSGYIEQHLVKSDNGTTFDRFNSGFGIEMNRQGKVLKVYYRNESPEWSKKLSVEYDFETKSDKSKPTFGEKNATTNEKTGNMASEERYLAHNANKEIRSAVDDVFTSLETNTGSKIKFKTKEMVVRIVTGTYKLDEANNADFSKGVDSAVEEILNQGIKGKMVDEATGESRQRTFRDTLTENEIQDFKDDFGRAMQKIVNLNGKTSEKADMRYEAQIVKNRLGGVINTLTERIQVMASNEKQYNTLRNKLQTSKSETSAGAWQDNPNMVNTISDLAKTVRLSTSSGQFTVNSVKQFLADHTELLANYNTDEYVGKDAKKSIPADYSELSLTMSGRNFIDSVKELNEYMGENSDIKTFDNDGLKLVNRVLSSANWATNADAKIQRAKNKSKIEGAILDARGITEVLQELEKKDNSFKKVMRNAVGQRYVLRNLMGDGELGDFIMAKPTEDIMNESNFELKQTKYLNDAMAKSGLEEKDAQGDISLETTEGTKFTVSRKQLWTMYLAEKTTDLSNDYEKNGITIYNKKTKTTGDKIKISMEDASKWFESNLSEKETDFLDTVYKDFINGSMAKEVGTYTKEKFGEDITEELSGDYMPNSKDNLRHTLSDGITKQSSLGSHRTVRRTNNANPSKLLDFDEVMSGYIHDVGQLTRMDNVREYNSLINTKDSKGMSIYNYYSNAVPDGKTMMDNWQKTINGIDDTKQLPSLFRNAMGVKVAANVGSILKQPLDYTRNLKNVNLSDWFKGLASGFKAWLVPSEHDALFSMLEDESKSYASNIAEKWYITANSVEGNISKITETLGKGMEKSNELVWAMMYKSLESKVIREYGYDKNTIDGQTSIKAKTLDLLDTLSTNTLSNSASYDMSNYRSGRQGQILQGLFSFWGDNQKNLENINEIFTGNSKSKTLVKGMEKSIKYKENAINALQSHIDEIKEKYEGESLPESKKIESDGYKERIKQLERSIDSSKSQIQVELKYQTDRPRRIASVASGLVASAVASVMISHLNSYLKGNEDASEMKTGEYWIESLKDAGFEAGTSWIPFIGTMTDAIRNNSDVSLITLDGMNKAVDTISNAITYAKAGKITTEQLKKEIGSGIDLVSNMTGLPVYSLLQYAEGGYANVKTMVGMNGKQSLANMRGYNSSYLTTQASSALSSGNLTDATKYNQANMYLFKGNNADFDTAKEITRVGATVSKTPDSINRSQKETFNGFYKKATPQVKKLINSSTYKTLTDDEKKSAINYVYSAYYQASKQLISTSDDDSSTTSTSKSAKVLLSNSNAEIGIVSAIIVKCKNKKKAQALSIIGKSRLSANQKKLARQLLGYDE